MDNSYLCRGKWIENGDWIIGYYMCIEASLKCFEPTEGKIKKDKGKPMIVVNSSASLSMLRPLVFYSIDITTLCRCAGFSAAKSYRGNNTEDLLIFEGDIVRADYIDEDGYIPEYAPIIYENACFYAKWSESTLQPLYVLLSERTDVEIVGNIHDNPELLGAIN